MHAMTHTQICMQQNTRMCTCRSIYYSVRVDPYITVHTQNTNTCRPSFNFMNRQLHHTYTSTENKRNTHNTQRNMCRYKNE